MSLRILHVLDHSIPLHSGYTFRTLSILREQQKRGWQTLQLTTPKQGASDADEEVCDDFTFFRTRLEKETGLIGQLFATTKRLQQAVDQFKPDLIHAHSPVLTAIPSLYISRRNDIPVVYEMRATWEDAAVDHGTTSLGSVRYRLSQLAETFCLRHAHAVTTICEGLRDEIASRGIPKAKVTVIPNAVDVDRFSSGSFGEGTDSGRNDSTRPLILGFIGSFYGYEGLDLLLNAMASLIAGGVNVQLVLVGGGPENERLQEQAARLDLGSHVQFVGRVSHDEVHHYYEQIDILVYPRWKTRLTDMVTPLKPLEAMAQGKLILASDVGGHQELIRDRETGFLFKADDVQALADAVQELLKERGSWHELQDRAKNFVWEERNWSRSVANYLSAYRVALAAKGRSVEVLCTDK